jgi:hypothetical protein
MADTSVRESIWSVRQDDLKRFSVLFPSSWAVGFIYQSRQVDQWLEVCWCRHWGCIWINSRSIGDTLLKLLTEEAGTVGLSAAIVSLMLIAGRRASMALFDWGYDRFTRTKRAREEAREERDQKWIAWNARREEADRLGQPFDEPPPAMAPTRDTPAHPR